MKEPLKDTSLGFTATMATDAVVLVLGRPPAPKRIDIIRNSNVRGEGCNCIELKFNSKIFSGWSETMGNC